jgi:hypothetical protein
MCCPPQSLENAAWLVEVAAHPIHLELSFHYGVTYEAGLPVGF